MHLHLNENSPATPKRVIFIIIPIRSSRCPYYKFPPGFIFFFFSLFHRKVPDVVAAAFIFVGSPARSAARSCGDRISERPVHLFSEHGHQLGLFAGGTRTSRLNGPAKHFFSTIESSRIVGLKGALSAPSSSPTSPLFDTQLSVFYGMALFDDPRSPSLS